MQISPQTPHPSIFLIPLSTSATEPPMSTTTTVIGKNWSTLSTPSFLVDEGIVRRNCRHMIDQVSARFRGKVTLRPHVKTHKTVEIARMQCGLETGDGTGGRVVTSTMAESRCFSRDASFREVYYAIPISYGKLQQAWGITQYMQQTGERKFCIEVDSGQTLAMVKRFLTETHDDEVHFHVFVNIDVGQHREGVDPDAPHAVDLVREVVQCSQLHFCGIYAHGGQSYHAHDRLAVAKEEAFATAKFVRCLREEQGIVCDAVSIGSTPTITALLKDESVMDWFPEEINEFHPGNYSFFDRMQAQMGSCHLTDAAVCVLVTVIGFSRERNTLLIDAGSLAMFKDTGVDDPNSPDFSYGHVFDDENLRLVSMSQELGTLTNTHSVIDFKRFTVGTKLRIVPNHSCLTAAMFSEYQVVNDIYDKENGKVVAQYVPCRGW